MSDAPLSKRLVYTDAGIAAIAQAWLDGHRQKEIARAFGYPNGLVISIQIRAFVQKFRGLELCYGDRQRARAAIANYIANRSCPR